MKIIVVGTGFVGLPHAAVLSEAGHEVYAYDIDPKKIAAYQSGDAAQIERFVNEPGLPAAIADTIDRSANAARARVNSLPQAILGQAFRGELTPVFAWVDPRS